MRTIATLQRFTDLPLRCSTSTFVALDALSLNGLDVRALPLVWREALPRRTIPANTGRVLYADHVVSGRALFTFVCERDLGAHRREVEARHTPRTVELAQDQELNVRRGTRSARS